MSSSIKNIAVVGASGSLGAPVVSELLSQGFTVTALTRSNSQSKFPPGVVVKKIDDFSSVSSLKAALQAQDAVISTIAIEAIGDQKTLADAAAAAGVKRFVPSEFGFNTRTVAADSPNFAKVIGEKTEFLDYLVEKAAEYDGFSWTGISTGSFLDWSLNNGLYGFNIAAKTATIYDSGDNPFQVASLQFIARAVAAVLKRPEETKNRYIAIGSNITQNEILLTLERETGRKWEIKRGSTADLIKAGSAALEKGQYGDAFVPFLLTYLFGEKHPLKSEESANKLLGLEEEDLAKVIGASVKSSAAALSS